MEFKTYRKSQPTRVRPLTQQNYEELHGIIQTREGAISFLPGDYLAKDALGEWPIKQTTIAAKYTFVAPEDHEGFLLYQRKGHVLAARMPEPFIINNMHGQTGDYLVIGDTGGAWPVQADIFEQTYERVEAI
jgi:hypothetical protein